MIRSAVKVLVIEAISNRVSGRFGTLSAKLAWP